MRANMMGFSAAALLLYAMVIGLQAGAEEQKAETVEFKINGEAVTKESLVKGLSEVNEAAPEVCPTETPSAIRLRRDRLVSLLPVKQFLAKEGIAVKDYEIEKRLDEMKADPDPFRQSPPKPLKHVMVRQAITFPDVKLMILTELGMQKWVEREWRKKWPTDKEWMTYCGEERAVFDKEFGKFTVLHFSLASWPKGAKDETEAMEILGKQAEAAKKMLDAGESFEKVAAELKGGKEAPKPALLPVGFLGEKNADAVRGIPEGKTSEPLRTPMAWLLVRRDAVADEDISLALKQRWQAKLRADTMQKIAGDAKLEKINWTDDIGAGSGGF